MTRNKILSVVLIAAMLAAIPLSMAVAATGTSTLGSGTILSISLNTDAVTSTTTGLVSLLDDAGATQNLKISLETAIKLNLVVPVTPDPATDGIPVNIPDPLDPLLKVSVMATGFEFVTDPVTNITTLTVMYTDAALLPQTASLDLEDALAQKLIIVNKEMLGAPVVIDPADIEQSTTFGKGINTLENYFGAALGVTAEELSGYKSDGFGYGVIAQAAWMATQLKGDAALLDQILMAKQSGDFSGLDIPGATNWGQLRKAVLTEGRQNFGQIMSGHATPIVTATPTETVTPLLSARSHGNGHAHGNGNAKGGGHK